MIKNRRISKDFSKNILSLYNNFERILHVCDNSFQKKIYTFITQKKQTFHLILYEKMQLMTFFKLKKELYKKKFSIILDHIKI